MNWFHSIRGRLAVISAVVIALVLTLAGLGLVLLFDTYIERRIAQELHGRILDVAGAFALNNVGKPALTRLPSDPRYRNPYSGAYWYVREGQAVVLRSRSLWDSDIVRPLANLTLVDSMTSARGPGETDVYLLEKSVSLTANSTQREFVLGVAVDKTEVQALSSSFGTELATGLGLIGLLLFVGAWLQAKYGLKPLSDIRQQLALFHSGERGQLDGPFPAEIETLAGDLNGLFKQQQEMIARARERAGSLAHGIKTPMTILYGEARRLELANQTQSAVFIRDQLDLIQQQVDRELARARAHGTSAGIGLQTDIEATVARLVELMKRMPNGDKIDWQLPKSGVHIAMDADDFGEVMGNLLDNARSWAHSVVVIEAGESGNGRVRISVSDNGPGIPSTYRQKALERGESNSNSSGLGLAIVSELIANYASALTLETSDMGGTRVWFEIDGRAKGKRS